MGINKKVLTVLLIRVRIVGLDEFGYLQVQDDTSRSIFSVHDDGNSFDMMAGLIKPKFR